MGNYLSHPPWSGFSSTQEKVRGLLRANSAWCEEDGIMEYWINGRLTQFFNIPPFHHSILSFLLLLIPYSPSRVFFLQGRYSFLVSIDSVGRSGLFYSNDIELFGLSIHTIQNQFYIPFCLVNIRFNLSDA